MALANISIVQFDARAFITSFARLGPDGTQTSGQSVCLLAFYRRRRRCRLQLGIVFA